MPNLLRSEDIGQVHSLFTRILQVSITCDKNDMVCLYISSVSVEFEYALFVHYAFVSPLKCATLMLHFFPQKYSVVFKKVIKCSENQ